MIYFRYMSLILGIYLSLAGLWILIFPQKYRELGERFMPEKRPLWFSPVCFAMFFWVLYTWYRYAGFQTALSLAVTVILSFTLVKVYYILFRYPQFREFARTFLSTPTPVLRTFAAFFVALGICLTAIGVTI